MRGILLFGILLTIFVAGVMPGNVKADGWVPAMGGEPSLVYWRANGTSYVNVSMVVGSTGFNVSDWGTPIQKGKSVSVNALIWMWTGYTFPIMITLSHTYDLGKLPAGEYAFLFRVWGLPRKHITFTSCTTVPDNYPTIQEAINNSSEEDQIFVRNGKYYENIVINKPLAVVGEGKSNTVIDGNFSGHTVEISANNVTFSGFTVGNSSSSHSGIFLYCAQYARIMHNTIVGNFYGVNHDRASYNSLFDNTIEGNQHSAVAFKCDSPFPVIENTIYLNSICNNQIGIYFDGNAYNNTVLRNYLVNNSVGVDLFYCGAGCNAIVQNNIIATQRCAVVFDDRGHKWDRGYPLGGNYWSDYVGTDSDQDGIGDTPYVINENNIDNYPLMHPWKLGDTNYDGTITVLDLIVIAYVLGSKPEDANWNPRADVKEDNIINVLDLILTAKYLGT